MGYAVANKQQWQQLRKAENTQNIITALFLPSGINTLKFVTLTGPVTRACEQWSAEVVVSQHRTPLEWL